MCKGEDKEKGICRCIGTSGTPTNYNAVAGYRCNICGERKP